ncbi:CDP-archaeol synthase [Marinobacter zhejiangensis]|uniref:Putative integral membrane protein DUF46 n=1 Tax=Marinobacter zhejiangensis TaxID=488535 RepID=A0A1I4SEV3_9GAMM|nr:CDP-archaeol synthase [Marinobacter zhejiangensis]SFM62904.1 Putative integral membrane protein DUF46 [Marinobacter zhejiangensis]
MLSFILFIMLVLANGAPVIAHKLIPGFWPGPVDGGRLWGDGRPLFGASKTWRGIASGVASCALFSVLVGVGFWFGLVFGLLALGGDLLSSFIKRRRGIPPSGRAIGLDQIPEALLPMLLAVIWLKLSFGLALLVVVVFVAANIGFSPLLYRLGIRRHPH